MGDTNEDHIPIGATPTAPLCIPGNKLLLRPGVDFAIDQSIGHPSAAGPAVVLMEHNIPANVHAPQGRSLGYGPLHGATGGGYGEALDPSPESGCGVVVRFAGIGMDVARDVHAIGRGSQAYHLV